MSDVLQRPCSLIPYKPVIPSYFGIRLASWALSEWDDGLLVRIVNIKMIVFNKNRWMCSLLHHLLSILMTEHKESSEQLLVLVWWISQYAHFCKLTGFILPAVTANDLQNLLIAVDSWCSKWRLKIKKDKTQIMHFRRKRETQSKFKRLFGSTLSYKEHYRYLRLGVVLNNIKFCRDLGYTT